MVSASWIRRKSSNRSVCEPRAPRCTSEINRVRKRRSGLSSLTESLPIRAPLTDSHDSAMTCDGTHQVPSLRGSFRRITPLTPWLAIAARCDSEATKPASLRAERRTSFCIPAARCASGFCENPCPSENEGAGNAGCTPHPLPCVQTKKTHAGQHRYAEITPALPAQWLYGCSVLSPEYRAC